LLSKSAFKIRTALNEKLNNSIHIRITSEPRLLCGRDPFEFIELDEYFIHEQYDDEDFMFYDEANQNDYLFYEI